LAKTLAYGGTAKITAIKAVKYRPLVIFSTPGLI
jgi:hypothetical protein